LPGVWIFIVYVKKWTFYFGEIGTFELGVDKRHSAQKTNTSQATPTDSATPYTARGTPALLLGMLSFLLEPAIVRNLPNGRKVSPAVVLI